MDNLNEDFEEESRLREQELLSSPIKSLNFKDIYRVFLETVEYGKKEDFGWLQKLKEYVKNEQ
jgi:hypothetical protein